MDSTPPDPGHVTPTPSRQAAVAFSTVDDDQRAILAAIADLHLDGGWFDADVTYGNGAFWRGGPEPTWRSDIDPQKPGVVAACSTDLPVPDDAFGSLVFDPPFLTYVRSGRSGNGAMVMAKRFGGFWRYDELEGYYRASLVEAARVVRRDGIIVVKCQDIVHNHALHPTVASVITEWGPAAGLRLLDNFVLTARHRMPGPNRRGRQRHARIHHSHFVVFRNRPLVRRARV